MGGGGSRGRRGRGGGSSHGRTGRGLGRLFRLVVGTKLPVRGKHPPVHDPYRFFFVAGHASPILVVNPAAGVRF